MYSYCIFMFFIVMYVLHSASLCCFVYCLCVNVYIQIPPGLNPIAVKKCIYTLYINIFL